jgi:hypothetical protein
VAAAGIKATEWTRANGIDGRSLNAWRMNLARRDACASAQKRRRPRPAPGSSMRGLVELVPTRLAASIPAATTDPGRYVLQVGGVRIELGDDFAEATLRRLLEVLRSC